MRPAPKIRRTGRLDFNARGQAVLVRGLSPIPTAFAPLPDGRILKIFRAQATPADANTLDQPLAAPGTWASDGRHYLRVAAADGWLDLLDVQLEGKKRLPVKELLLGFKLPAQSVNPFYSAFTMVSIC